MDIMQIRNELLSGTKSVYDLNLRVVDYSRVSTDQIGQEKSLINQQSYYREMIENNTNWIYSGSYTDDGVTGTRTSGRDEFNKMIEDGLDGKFDLIITKEVSRFARNTLDSIFYTRELLTNGVGVFFESDNINTLFPDSEFKLTIMASLAQEESRKTSQRVKWAKRKMIKDGVIFMPPNMHGYEMIDGKVTIVEDEAVMIRKIFEFYLKGLGFRKIGQELHKLGYVNSNGNPYNYTTLRGILVNPRYKGFFTGGMTEKMDFMSTKITYKDQEDWIMYRAPEIVPPIVSEEVWDKANEILEAKRKKVSLKHTTSYQNKYKYSGKIYCKEHDVAYHRTIYRYVKSEDRELYQCKVYRENGKDACGSPLLYTKELDAILACIFKSLFKRKDDLIDSLMKIIAKYLADEDFTKDITRVMTEIEKMGRRKVKLIDLVTDELITKDEFKERNTEFNESIELLEEELDRYEQLRKAKRSSMDQLNLMNQFLKREFDLDVGVPDELIDAFVDKVYVSKGDINDLVVLKVKLKTGQDIPIYYRKDLSLSLATHIGRDKMMFEFPRTKNNRTIEPMRVMVEDVELQIAI